MPEQSYVGDELELFRDAVCWKAYWSKFVRPYLRGAVLEVGAGIGGNASYLAAPPTSRYTALEPDPELAVELSRAAAALDPPGEVITGTLADLPATREFDAIVYADVLEHIEGDREELELAAAHLAPGGSLVVLVPAHPKLYSEFDAAIGHHRRYRRRDLAAISPASLQTERLAYLDSVGLLASTTNRLLLRRDLPTPGQIRFWDRVLVRASKILDPVTLRRVGKSLVGVWRRPAGASSGT